MSCISSTQQPHVARENRLYTEQSKNTLEHEVLLDKTGLEHYLLHNKGSCWMNRKMAPKAVTYLETRKNHLVSFTEHFDSYR